GVGRRVRLQPHPRGGGVEHRGPAGAARSEVLVQRAARHHRPRRGRDVRPGQDIHQAVRERRRCLRLPGTLPRLRPVPSSRPPAPRWQRRAAAGNLWRRRGRGRSRRAWRAPPRRHLRVLQPARVARRSGRLPRPSTVYVSTSLTASISTRIGPIPGSGVSAAQVHLFLAGSLLRVSRRGSLAALVRAPSARFRAGTSTNLEGSFAAADMRFKRTTVQFVSGETASTTTTTLPPTSICGDGIVGPGEVCDGDVACTSPGGSFLTCSACGSFTTGPCTPKRPPSQPRCGDRKLDRGGPCDDGNTKDCDGCSARCTIERVGNGVLDCDEECDDGNTVDCDGCDANGELECGNGVIDDECGEVCDGDDLGGRTCPGGTVTCAA